jgi:hypothetical protein
MNTGETMTITQEYNPLFRETIPVARFRSCEAHLMETETGEINIQYIQSDNQGQGDAQGLVRGLLQHCKNNGLILSSSSPISEIWEHICRKYSIKIYQSPDHG